MTPEERREYDRNRWQRRRATLIELLGGACISCGATGQLEFDHVDPASKEFTISSGLFKAWSEILDEVAKCQLLCKPCHKNKSDSGKAVDHGGGLSGKKNCPCLPCKKRKASYMREYQRSRKARLVK